MAAKEVDLQQQKVFATSGCGRVTLTVAGLRAGVRRAQQMGRQLESVGGEHVVVGQSVDQQQRPAQVGSQWQQGTVIVGRGVDAGLPAQRSVQRGVVQPPFGDGAPATAAWKTSGVVGRQAPRGSRRRTSPGCRPGRDPAGPDSASVPIQRRDLVLQSRVRRSPATACSMLVTARGAPAVRHHYAESLVGQPLSTGICTLGRRGPVGRGPPYGYIRIGRRCSDGWVGHNTTVCTALAVLGKRERWAATVGSSARFSMMVSGA